MSDRLLSEVSGHSDYSGYGSHAGYDMPDPGGSYHDGYPGGYPWHGQDAYANGGWDSGGYPVAEPQPAAGYGWDGQAYGTGGQGDLTPGYEQFGQQYGQYESDVYDSGAYPVYPEQAGHAEPSLDEVTGGDAEFAAEPAWEPELRAEAEPVPDAYADLDTDVDAEPEPEPEPVVGERRPAGRGRRRTSRPRRSAFLSVAAPSLCVLGVTAVATAATVSESDGGRGGEPAPVAQPDPGEVRQVAANEQFDTQLTGLSAAATDYADRASRTQGRIDLEAQQEAEAEAAAAEAARLEALRPKFFLPVEQHGLSAYFGQSGINWMSTHTGIDFPVSYGTSVRAATDGSISTQYHPSYGNMTILTAPDGTETWYAHLSSHVYTSGWVQAGTVIAYSGNSGTSTGPHLHFEVRPGGGSPVDPLTWLRGKGLEPT
ncbi:M23 family metallopeptidase [Streptomyces litchfieldiae]|uniref:M23 family metallopeptidase n=1 Tax=Streptomyces litchfieldiae TaxID=3075543 RepID=A0ABU2N039_9ACTN|nr:M23 family metallopeptidase [Streptomyces sp. DSM 44938]MDT0347268.1 M23 family metallopeptidase [Streptomyces sp. DSM 44938]